MINLIDRLFAGWAPHDIMWYSWCIMAGMILLCWAIGAGIARKRREARTVRHTASGRHAAEYDLPMGEET